MNVATILKFKGRDVLTARSDIPLMEIAALLGSHRIGCIVIVDEDGKVAGIVSERDIVRVVGSEGPEALNEPVETCMTKTVVTCREGDTIDRLMSEMTLLPLIHTGNTVNRILGSMSAFDPPFWLGATPLRHCEIAKLDLHWPSAEQDPPAPKPTMDRPLSATDIVRSVRHRFRVYQGGLD